MVKTKKKLRKKRIFEYVENKTKIIFVSLLLLALAIIVFSFFFGIKIKFILNEEIRVELNPTYMSFSLHYSESPDVNFTIKSHNFKFCNSFCEYKLRDLKTNEVIHYSNKTLKSDQTVARKYKFPPNNIGSGQSIYLFEVECNNIRTAICSTEEEKSYKSAFIIINYDLSEDEKEAKEETREELITYLSKIKESEMIAKNNEIRTSFFETENLFVVPGEVVYLKNKNEMLEQEFLNLTGYLNILKNMWDNRDYFRLKNNFDDNLENKIIKYEKEAENQSNLVSETIVLYNNLINISLFLVSKQETLNEINNYYLKKEDNRTNDLNDYYNLLSETLLKTEQGNISQYKSTYDLLKSLEKEFYEINEDYLLNKKKEEEEFINYTREVLNISFFNESEDYCLLINHTFCYEPSFNDSFNLSFSMDYIYEDQLARDITLETNTTLSEYYAECCAFNKCMRCCENCEEKYPIVFIHGHLLNKENSPEISLNRFSNIQRRLMDDGYINAGQIDFGSTLEEIGEGEFGSMPFPVTLRISYYYITYYDLGSYVVTAEKSDRIENYAIRLKESIELIKEKTGRDKVNIVAHSMGGLVARSYLSIFGENDVDKLIMIGTPNKGIKGRVSDLCSVVGSSKGCDDMAEGSVFLKRLNNPKNIPRNTKFYTIAAKGCDIGGEEGDGIVTVDSVFLDYAGNFMVNGTCTDFFGTNLHSRMLDPNIYPETYEIIREILEQ